jgi:hypothetical protein
VEIYKNFIEKINNFEIKRILFEQISSELHSLNASFDMKFLTKLIRKTSLKSKNFQTLRLFEK